MAGKENSNEGKQAGDQQIENLESMISIKSEDKIKKSSLNEFEISQKAKDLKDWKCPVENCNISRTSIKGLKHHLRKMHGEKKYACKVCNKKFALKSLLNTHIQKGHTIGDEVTKYKCDVCDYVPSFPSLYSIKVHKEAVHLQIKHICPECSRKCTTKSNLSKHIVQEHTDHEIVCTFIAEGSNDIKCSYKAKNSRAMKLHIHEHGEKREWECSLEDCDITGKSLKYIRHHIQRVHEEKKFECPNCANKYSVKSDLTGHIKRIHLRTTRAKEGLLLYCGECEFSSKNSRYMNIHRKGHHDYRKWWEANWSELAVINKGLLDKENIQHTNV